MDSSIVRRPIHETIVEAINQASAMECLTLAQLICRTIIPANHDVIIKAWREKLRQLGWTECGDEVITSLEQQKRAYEHLEIAE